MTSGLDRGVFLAGFSLFGVCLLALGVFSCDNTILFWLFMELAGLCLVPSFFLTGSCLEGLYSYLIVSSISSGLIVSSLLVNGLGNFIIWGFMVKLGVFPFVSWVYSMIVGLGWLSVWLFSTFLKIPVFMLSFYCNNSVSIVCEVLVCISFFMLGLFFWFFTNSWRLCWCHMMLSSSCVLFLVSSGQSFDLLVGIFICYLIWSSFVISFFSSYESEEFQGIFLKFFSSFWFCWLLISFPLSLSIFYKLVLCFGIYSVSFWCLVFWVFYSILEQLYLLSLVSSFKVSTWGFGEV